MSRTWQAIGLFVLALAIVFVWRAATAKSDAQIAAEQNLELIDAIEGAWREHQLDAATSLFDVSRYERFRANLKLIDLYDAGEDVKALRDRFYRYCDEAPRVLDTFKEGPDAPTDNRALAQRAAEDWSLKVRNAAIQVELLVRDVDRDFFRLRDKYRDIVRGERAAESPD